MRIFTGIWEEVHSSGTFWERTLGYSHGLSATDADSSGVTTTWDLETSTPGGCLGGLVLGFLQAVVTSEVTLEERVIKSPWSPHGKMPPHTGVTPGGLQSPVCCSLMHR